MYSSAVIAAALDLKPDQMGNLHALGHLRAGKKHGRSIYYDTATVLLIALALRLSKLIGQAAAFRITFGDGFLDELLDALDAGLPLVLMQHAIRRQKPSTFLLRRFSRHCIGRSSLSPRNTGFRQSISGRNTPRPGG
jgi:hypothetical protein